MCRRDCYLSIPAGMSAKVIKPVSKTKKSIVLGQSNKVESNTHPHRQTDRHRAFSVNPRGNNTDQTVQGSKGVKREQCVAKRSDTSCSMPLCLKLQCQRWR